VIRLYIAALLWNAHLVWSTNKWIRSGLPEEQLEAFNQLEALDVLEQVMAEG
jgi:hypothetical protein